MTLDEIKDSNSSSLQFEKKKLILHQERGRLEEQVKMCCSSLNIISPSPITENSNDYQQQHDDDKMLMYVVALENVKEANDSLVNLKVESQGIVDGLNTRLQIEQRKDEDIRQAFQAFRRKILEQQGTPSDTSKATTKAKGSAITNGISNSSSIRDVLEMEQEEESKASEIEKLRLVMIKSRLQLEMLERKLIAKEQIETGFDLIGLEQLRGEHKRMIKKNLDLENDLRRLKSKEKMTTASISQSKRIIYTVTEETRVAQQTLHDLDKCIVQRKEELSTRMKKRDEIQTTTKWKANLASNAIVRENYETSKLEEKRMRKYLDSLKTRHHNLTIVSSA